MKRDLKRRFLLEHYRQETFLKFYNLRQYVLTMKKYMLEFELLILKCDIVKP